ncbi:hypothetical protein CJU89_4252 [Yarrowia sp. B02]|nr:hypothetical protein CJU89_4252 [Yarrowia sp. B02]
MAILGALKVTVGKLENLVLPEELSFNDFAANPLYISVGVTSTLTTACTHGQLVEPRGRNLPAIRWGQVLDIAVEPHTYPLRRVTLSVFARFSGPEDNHNRSIGHCSLEVNEHEMEELATFSSPLKHAGFKVGNLQIRARFVFTKEGLKYFAELERQNKSAPYKPFASIKSLSGAASDDVPTLRSLKSAGSSRSARSSKGDKKNKLKSFLSLFSSKDESLEDIIPPVVQQAERAKSRGGSRASTSRLTKSSAKPPQLAVDAKSTTIRTTNSRAKIEPSRLGHKFRNDLPREASGVVSSNPSHFREFSSSSSVYHQPPSASFSPYTQKMLTDARDTEMALKERRVSRNNPPDLKSRGTDYSAEVETFSQFGTNDNHLMSPDLGSKLVSPLSSRISSDAHSYNEQVQPLIVRKSRGGAGTATGTANNTAGSFLHQGRLGGSADTRGNIPSRQSDQNSMLGMAREFHSSGGQYLPNAGHAGQYGDVHNQQWSQSQSKLLRNEWQDENQNGISCQFCGRFNPL